jgi:hypothetical protein
MAVLPFMFLLPTLSPRFYVWPLKEVVRAWTQPAGAMPELFPCHLHRRLDISACATRRCSATSTSRISGLQPAVRTPIEGQPSWLPPGCWLSCGRPCHDVNKLRGPLRLSYTLLSSSSLLTMSRFTQGSHCKDTVLLWPCKPPLSIFKISYGVHLHAMVRLRPDLQEHVLQSIRMCVQANEKSSSIISSNSIQYVNK